MVEALPPAPDVDPLVPPVVEPPAPLVVPLPVAAATVVVRTQPPRMPG